MREHEATIDCCTPEQHAFVAGTKAASAAVVA